MGLQSAFSHFVMQYLVVPRAPRVLPQKKKLACIGDSITFGAGVPKHRSTSTWTYHLGQRLGEDWQVLNYGISGRTLQNEGDYPYTAERFWKLSHAVEADVYLIMLGTNDAKPYNWDAARYARELQTFTESYMALKNLPRVILMTPPSCFADAGTGVVNFDIDPVQIDGPIYRTVQETAKSLQLSCIDLHSFTENHPEWFDDGVHPNYAGNRAIAEYLFDALKERI